MNSEPSAGGRSVIRVSSVIIVHLYAGLNTERSYKKLIHAPSVFVVVIMCIYLCSGHFYWEGVISGWAYIRNNSFANGWAYIRGGLKPGGGFKVGLYSICSAVHAHLATCTHGHPIDV